MQRSIAVSLVGLVALVGGCSPTATPSAAPSGTGPGSVSASLSTPVTPSVPATAGAGTVIDPATLPDATLDPARTTAVCDAPPPNDAVPCADAAELAARVSADRSDSPARIWYERPADVIHVGASTESISITLNEADGTITVAPAAPAWPDAPAFVAPAAALAPLPGAPASVAGRQALPYCGTASAGEVAPLTCFLSAVLTGTPAEAVVLVPDTGATWLYRFAGTGAVIRTRHDSGPWMQGAGSVVLDSSPGGWSFDPWPEPETPITP
jgi:hypothetical protein